MPTSATKRTLTEALADLPPRVRVHELARRAGLDSKSAIAALTDAGVSVGSASSSVDREVAESLLTSLLGGGAAAPGAAKSGGTSGGAKTSAKSGGVKTSAKSGTAKSGGAKSSTAKSGSTTVPSEDGAAAAETDSKPTGRRGSGATKAAAAENPAEGTSASDAEGAGEQKTSSGRRSSTRNKSAAAKAAPSKAAASESGDADHADGSADSTSDDAPATPSRRGGQRGRTPQKAPDTAVASEDDGAESDEEPSEDRESSGGRSRRRRRGGRGRRRGGADAGDEASAEETVAEPDVEASGESAADDSGADESSEDEDGESSSSRRRRRRRRRRGGSSGEADTASDADRDGEHHDVRGVKGSTRLEAKRQRRRDGRDSRRRPQILSEAEFLARRESVDRVMAVRQHGDLSQVALLEDGVLVEHFVSRQGSASMIGNIYLGTVQNVLPSMEAAFVDIGKGRNAVLYAGEVNWDISGLEGKERRIETALSSGDTVLVQVSKDPIGHKGARLTTQISLPGRFLVFVPGGGATGISRKLPENERKRLKKILDAIVPAEAGVIIRTAAEGVGEEDLAADVARLQAQWEQISAAAEKAPKGGTPQQLYAEPDTLIKVIRDLFNSDINRLLVDGDDAWASVSEYVLGVAPELADRVSRYVGDRDVFAAFRIDEQISKALQRKVRLPSGGSLVIDRTEAMTVVDVNTGKFTGSGGNLEETVTRNNLEAAEEIVRQLRLRDIGGIIVVDFIDMVLESNRDLVLRRLTECLGRDRTRHQVAEVTSLGLVQMTRKRMGLGLVEAFSEPCATCQGRGIVLHDTPAEMGAAESEHVDGGNRRRGRRRGRGHDDEARFEPLVVERVTADAKPDPRGPKPPALFRSEEDGAGAAEPADETGVASDAVEPDVPGVVDDSAHVVEAPSAETAGAADGGTAPVDEASMVDASTAEVEAAVAETEAPAVEAPAVEAPAVTETQAPAARPSRRRRAAGRPAGAPSTTTTTVDMVLGGAGD